MEVRLMLDVWSSVELTTFRLMVDARALEISPPTGDTGYIAEPYLRREPGAP
jgi:hypothetical protein